jgi:hypothetical protein
LIKMKYAGGQFSRLRTVSIIRENGARADSTVSASSCQKLCAPNDGSRNAAARRIIPSSAANSARKRDLPFSLNLFACRDLYAKFEVVR